MEPFRASLPPEVFGPMAVPPRTDGSNSLRENLRKARELLTQAGWTYRDGALRNAKGEAFTIEFLDSTEASGNTTTAAWRRALEKLGIDFQLHEVDFALWQQRLHRPGTVESETESLFAHRLMAAAIKSRQRDVAADAARAIMLITRHALHPEPNRNSIEPRWPI